MPKRRSGNAKLFAEHGCEVRNVGAFFITHTILGVPYYNYSILGPKNPIFIIRAPAVVHQNIFVLRSPQLLRLEIPEAVNPGRIAFRALRIRVLEIFPLQARLQLLSPKAPKRASNRPAQHKSNESKGPNTTAIHGFPISTEPNQPKWRGGDPCFYWEWLCSRCRRAGT